MDTSFDELKSITDAVYSGNYTANFHQDIVNLLERHGIKLRQDDGSNPIATISHPISLPGTMVVGLRYTKEDLTKTEDYFLFQQREEIKRLYGTKLEKLIPEYKGAHKLQR